MIDASEALQYMGAIINKLKAELATVQADALADHLELSGAVSLLKDAEAENARLRDLLKWALTYVETEHERGSNLPTEEKMLGLARVALKGESND